MLFKSFNQSSVPSFWEEWSEMLRSSFQRRLSISFSATFLEDKDFYTMNISTWTRPGTSLPTAISSVSWVFWCSWGRSATTLICLRLERLSHHSSWPTRTKSNTSFHLSFWRSWIRAKTSAMSIWAIWVLDLLITNHVLDLWRRDSLSLFLTSPCLLPLTQVSILWDQIPIYTSQTAFPRAWCKTDLSKTV